jgi:hypothetical protein
LLPGGFEIRDMTRMKEVKTTVGHHQPLAGRALGLPPFRQLALRDDFAPKIHSLRLAERFRPVQGSKTSKTQKPPTGRNIRTCGVEIPGNANHLLQNDDIQETYDDNLFTPEILKRPPLYAPCPELYACC